MNTKDTKRKEGEVFTYRITPAGDGRFFSWKKYDDKGEEVEQGQQLFTSAADAEKAARAVVTGGDVIAVAYMTTVDKDDNGNVVYETAAPEETTKFGAAIKYAPNSKDADTSERHRNELTPAQRAVNEGNVAPLETEEAVRAREEAEEKRAAQEAKEAKKEEKK